MHEMQDPEMIGQQNKKKLRRLEVWVVSSKPAKNNKNGITDSLFFAADNLSRTVSANDFPYSLAAFCAFFCRNSNLSFHSRSSSDECASTHWSPKRQNPGTDVLIFKNVFAEKIAETIGVFLYNLQLVFAKI
jgi:hypothetical protein